MEAEGQADARRARQRRMQVDVVDAVRPVRRADATCRSSRCRCLRVEQVEHIDATAHALAEPIAAFDVDERGRLRADRVVFDERSRTEVPQPQAAEDVAQASTVAPPARRRVSTDPGMRSPCRIDVGETAARPARHRRRASATAWGDSSSPTRRRSGGSDARLRWCRRRRRRRARSRATASRADTWTAGAGRRPFARRPPRPWRARAA